ncbi:hypothetical protein [Allofournierella sp.]|uniref:hypothetical protein n=1 Tax=Allofournierella sp. TaxID=1940256 RepID=UPI003AB87485
MKKKSMLTKLCASLLSVTLTTAFLFSATPLAYAQQLQPPGDSLGAEGNVVAATDPVPAETTESVMPEVDEASSADSLPPVGEAEPTSIAQDPVPVSSEPHSVSPQESVLPDSSTLPETAAPAGQPAPQSPPVVFALASGTPGGAAGNVISHQAFNDATSLTNFTDLLGGGRTLSLGAAQTAHAEGSGGDALFLYSTQERSVCNGVVAVDISTGSAYRCGVMFRAVDADTYSWVGFDNSGTLRIREKTGGQESDILLNGKSIPQQFTLQVEYWQDNLKILIDGTSIYDGVRPLVNKYAASANAPAEGKCGLVGWSIFNVDFDNLYVCEYAPTVTGVSAAGLIESTVDGSAIRLVFAADTDLSSLVLNFETSPQGATASPTGAQDLLGKTVDYTLSLAQGGSRVYHVSASRMAAGSYLNPFDGSNNQTLIDSLQDIHSDASGIKMTHTNGQVYSTTNTGSGNHLWMDTNSPSAESGFAAVDYSENASQWRTGLLLRAQDGQNYTWVGIQSSNSLRIRECLGGTEKDIIESITLPGSKFTLKAAYFEDELAIYAGDVLLYQGPRPHKKENTAQPAGQGKIGMMGWDHTGTAFDNLRFEPFAPFLTEVGTTGTITGTAVTFVEPEGTDLAHYTPALTAFPQSAVISPAGPQDFSTQEAQQNGLPYTVTAGGVSTQYQIKVTTAAGQLMVLENTDVRIELNKAFPTVYRYRLKGNDTVFGGAALTQNTVKINGSAYTPQNVTVTSEPANKAVQYHVEISGVSVGTETKAVSFDVRYTLSGSELAMTIGNVTGDVENQRFQITLDAPVITLAGSEPDAKIAYGGVNGNGGSGVKAISGGSLNTGSVSWPFLASSHAAAAVYTQDQWNRPYTVKISGGNGEIWSDGYYHRMADGVRPIKDAENGLTTEIIYRQTVYLCADANGNGTVDWQDAALWTRTQIPQMPQSVRNFFNGGGWAQTHAAFPGNGQAGYVGNYKGFTTVYSTIDQLLEVQRQIYHLTDGMGKFTMEVVGWNGRGHDYGWPNINEVTFNPALGTEANFRAAQTAIQQYGGDLSFHTNMSDMTDNSASYLRNTAQSPYGNGSSNTNQRSYGSNVFGWNAWFISHFKDLPYALNRQDAFIGAGGRFLAPQFLYSDVMLDKPASQLGTTAADEQYAKFRLTDHYRTLGSSLATEYYYSEKRTGGLFLMKNYSSPSLVDQFINAGQTIFNDTRNVNVQAQDYIWASLYSDTYRDGNLNVASTGAGNAAALDQVEELFLLGYVNGFVAQHGLLSYGTDAAGQFTQWGDGVQYRVSGNTLTVTKNGKTVALLKLANGRITGDCFVPAYHDASKRIFAYSSAGGAKTWDIPADVSAQNFKLYRLTESGRVFVDELSKTAGQISFQADAGVGYVLDYTGAARPADAVENLALTAKVTASSNQQRASWKEDAKGKPVASEDLYIKKGDLTGSESDTWATGNDALLKNLTGAMLKEGDARYLRYHRFVISGFAADGVEDTYWMPAASDASPVLHFELAGPRSLASFQLDYSLDTAGKTLEVRITDENGRVLYSGPAASGTAYTLSPIAETHTINLAFTNAVSSDHLKLREATLLSSTSAAS